MKSASSARVASDLPQKSQEFFYLCHLTETRQWRTFVGDLSATIRELSGSFLTELQPPEGFAWIVLSSSEPRSFGVSPALESKEVRRKLMTDATPRTATKRAAASQNPARSHVPLTSVHKVEADGVQVFYRAAGDANAPVISYCTDSLHHLSCSANSFRAWQMITG